MSVAETAEIAASFRETASQWAALFAEGRARKANHAFDRMQRLIAALQGAGSDGAEALVALLADEDLGVRLCAGIEALAIDPVRAAQILQDIADGPPGMIRFQAAQTLSRWRSGELVLPRWPA